MDLNKYYLHALRIKQLSVGDRVLQYDINSEGTGLVPVIETVEGINSTLGVYSYRFSDERGYGTSSGFSGNDSVILVLDLEELNGTEGQDS